VAVLGTEGAFAVAWSDWDGNIYVQRFGDDGEMAGPADRLELRDDMDMDMDMDILVSNVQIAALGDDGSYAVSWTAQAIWYGDFGPVPGLRSVFVQRFNLDGSTSQDVSVEVGDDVRVSSSEPGMAYLVSADIADTFENQGIAALTDSNTDNWNSVAINVGHRSTELSTEGLALGEYKLYTRDESGLWSAASEHTVTVEPNTTRPSVWLDGGLGVDPLYPPDEAWFNSSEKGTAYLIRTDLTENLERLRRQLRDIELQAESQISSRMEAAKAAAQGAASDPQRDDHGDDRADRPGRDVAQAEGEGHAAGRPDGQAGKHGGEGDKAEDGQQGDGFESGGHGGLAGRMR
jgi:hypothetical protein